jgi:hypothetical protein
MESRKCWDGYGQTHRRFRSWGEEQIARLLDRNGIAFRYEHPLAVVDGGKVKIWYPDFYLPHYGLIAEYFGFNGDHGYDATAHHKIQVYTNEGIDGLFLTRDSLRGDWPTKVLGDIENKLKTRLEIFYKRTTEVR